MSNAAKEAAEISPAIIGSVIAAVLDNPKVRTATKLMAPNVVVRASRYTRHDGRARRIDLRVTMGRPNYATRALIARMEEAGEPFPVRKIQLKHWPAKAPTKKSTRRKK